MTFGFSVNIVVAAAVYLLGFLVMRRFPAKDVPSGCTCDLQSTVRQVQ
jgi:hypothetical protein